jgi:hypothetical protein
VSMFLRRFFREKNQHESLLNPSMTRNSARSFTLTRDSPRPVPTAGAANYLGRSRRSPSGPRLSCSSYPSSLVCYSPFSRSAQSRYLFNTEVRYQRFDAVQAIFTFLAFPPPAELPGAWLESNEPMPLALEKIVDLANIREQTPPKQPPVIESRDNS